MPEKVIDMNIETKIIDYLKKKGFQAYANVPSSRPASFVTVERTGGSHDSVVIDRPTVAIQAWADKRLSASELAYSVRDALIGMVSEVNICKVSINSIYNFPDLESGVSRYQMIIDFVVQEG